MNGLYRTLTITFVISVSAAPFAQAPRQPAQTDATPFGLSMGMTRQQVEAVAGPLHNTGGLPQLAKVPRPHQAFMSYNVLLSQKHGLCVINAVSKPVQLNAFGDQLKTAMKEIVTQLTPRYGPPTPVDILKTGSIWDEPEDWSTAIAKEERIFGFFWSPPKDAPSLSSVEMVAKGASSSLGAFILTYRAKEFDACKAELDASQGSSL